MKHASFSTILVHSVRLIRSSLDFMIVDWQLNSRRRSILTIGFPKPQGFYRMFGQDQNINWLSRLMKFCRLFHCAGVFASVTSDWSKTRLFIKKSIACERYSGFGQEQSRWKSRRLTSLTDSCFVRRRLRPCHQSWESACWLRNQHD